MVLICLILTDHGNQHGVENACHNRFRDILVVLHEFLDVPFLVSVAMNLHNVLVFLYLSCYRSLWISVTPILLFLF